MARSHAIWVDGIMVAVKDFTDRLEGEGGWQPASGRIMTGSRPELARGLLGVADGCLGTKEYRQEAREAAEQLIAGATRVKAGHTWYYVVDTGDG